MKKLILAAMVMGVSGGVMADDNFDEVASESILTEKFCSFELKVADAGNRATFDKTWTVLNDGDKVIDTIEAGTVTRTDGQKIGDVALTAPDYSAKDLDTGGESDGFSFTGTPVDGTYQSTITIACKG